MRTLMYWVLFLGVIFAFIGCLPDEETQQKISNLQEQIARLTEEMKETWKAHGRGELTTAEAEFRAKEYMREIERLTEETKKTADESGKPWWWIALMIGLDTLWRGLPSKGPFGALLNQGRKKMGFKASY